MTQKQPTTLITGASGFLGSQVLRVIQSCEQHRQVLIATRGQSVVNSEFQTVQNLRMDLLNDFKLPKDVHTVIHIAGEKQNELLMETVNYYGTRKLIEAAFESGVCRFVYVSSVGVYGAFPHAGLVTEAFPHTPRNLYEKSKDAGEKCVRELCVKFGIEFVVVQPSNVIGIVPGHSYPLLGLMRMVKNGRFTWFGDTEPWVNYVAVEDAANAVVIAAERAPSGQTFIINTPEHLRDVIGWISDELGIAAPRRCLPLWIGKVAAEFGHAASWILHRSVPFNREKLRELTNTTRYDGSAMEQVAGFEYSLGVKKMIQTMVRTYLHEGVL